MTKKDDIRCIFLWAIIRLPYNHGDKPVCELILGKYGRPTDEFGFAHYDVKWQISGIAIVEYLKKSPQS